MLIDTVRLGLGRGLIEFRQSLTLVLNYIFFPCIALIVMYFLRGVEVSGSGTSLGSFAIPGVLAINVLFSGLMGLATNLIAEAITRIHGNQLDELAARLARMLGIDNPPVVIEQAIIPPIAHGVKAMSMDYFVADDQAVDD